ncbi:uncharacterized protein [Ptychodera flava]|uniref:uncharacterized protein n=1 Tax=Ptychodera flava TaxID=63121 RepID=UPI003969ECC1
MTVIQKGSNSDIIAISVTCTVIVVVLIVGIVLGILYYNKRAVKIQSGNTDYANAGQDISAYAEITASTLTDKQEPKALSEEIDITRFVEPPGNSPQHVAIDGSNITSSPRTKAAPQTYDEVDPNLDLVALGSRTSPTLTIQSKWNMHHYSPYHQVNIKV